MNYNYKSIKLNRRLIIGFSLLLLLAGILFKIFSNGETLAKPKVGPVVDSVFALGTVKTDKQYNVRFGMNTIVRKLYVHEGDKVGQGAPLVMNDSSLVARSPFDGIVTGVAYLEGELAPSGQKILSVSGTGSMYIKVSLDQESIILVKKEQLAEISFEKMRSEMITGRVSSVYMSEDEFLVRIDVDDLPQWVLPGMTCDVAITIRRNDNAVLIPADAIKNGYVEIKRKGSGMSIKVESKPVDENWSEITDGSILPDDIIYINKKSGQGDGGRRNN